MTTHLPLNIKEQVFHTGTITLNYAEGRASGVPLVLLHGGSARWQASENIMPILAEIYHVFAPDFRGHGKSDWVHGGYRLQDFTDDIIAFLRGCVPSPAMLLGHSLGGIVGLMVAAQAPDLVKAVIVGDSPLDATTWQTHLKESQDKLIAWRDLAGGARPKSAVIEVLKDSLIAAPDATSLKPMRQVFGEDASVFQWIATNLSQHDPNMLTMLLDEFSSVATGYEMEALFPAIHCPVMLLQADPSSGGLMTDAEVECAMTLLPQPSHVRLQGISHVLHNEQKDPVLAAILNFLKMV